MPPTINPTTPPSEPPIRVTPKIRGIAGKWKNVFINDRGFPNQSNNFDSLLHNVDRGTILRKKNTPPHHWMPSTRVFMQCMTRSWTANNSASISTFPT